ncbi:hypothetical protein AYI69_g6125 [Smittium culicis]|uniref:BZIP domain-containing protein n=1 Tax=Smittium culicis TaxID=133412 RepID=A0A1R1Y136_9FUNG|nr:hypothetical protein AYI69_g6125 [Smittium culicis]
MNQDQLDYVVFKLWSALSSTPSNPTNPPHQVLQDFSQINPSAQLETQKCFGNFPVPQYNDLLGTPYSLPNLNQANQFMPYQNPNSFKQNFLPPNMGFNPTINNNMPQLPVNSENTFTFSPPSDNLDMLISSIMSPSTNTASNSPLSTSFSSGTPAFESFEYIPSNKQDILSAIAPHPSPTKYQSPISDASTKFSPAIVSMPSEPANTNKDLNTIESSFDSSAPVENVKDSVNIRKRCDNEFLASLPPQLALKRRRARSAKQTAIIEELLNSTNNGNLNSSTSSVSIFSEPIAQVDTVKRHRNTDAARRSRLRKALRMETLEKQVVELELENKSLRESLQTFENEKLESIKREECLKRQIQEMTILLSESINN